MEPHVMDTRVRVYKGVFSNPYPEILVYAHLTLVEPGYIKFKTNFRGRVVLGASRFFDIKVWKEVSFGVTPVGDLPKEPVLEVLYSRHSVNGPSDLHLSRRISVDIPSDVPDAPGIVYREYFTFAPLRRLKALHTALRNNKIESLKGSIKRDLYNWSNKEADGSKDLLMRILLSLDKKNPDVETEMLDIMNKISRQELILEK